MDFLYNKTTEAFLLKLKKMLKTIMLDEMKLVFQSSRFLYRGYYHPIKLVVFEKEKLLGFYDANSYTLGLHKRLMFSAKDDVIKNILRHELAHLMCHLTFGNNVAIHGNEFKQIVKAYGWDETVANSTSNIDEENEESGIDIKSERMIETVKKLLKLAESSNEHESKLATIKANQILLKYNLENLTQNEALEDDTIVRRVMSYKRSSSLHTAIYEILQNFFVSPVFNTTRHGGHLEIIGTRTNVELASYITNFLEHEFNFLWSLHKKSHGLSGIRDKNSFFIGLAKGFCQKLKESESNLSSNPVQDLDKIKDLKIIKNDLDLRLSKVYPRLGRKSISSNFNSKSLELGRSAGKNLNIRPAVKNNSNNIKLLN